MGHKADPDSSANRDLNWQATVVYKIKYNSEKYSAKYDARNKPI